MSEVRAKSVDYLAPSQICKDQVFQDFGAQVTWVWGQNPGALVNIQKA